MYEQKFYLSIENINFCICVFPIILPKKNAQILKGVLSWGDILLINPRENRENFTPTHWFPATVNSFISFTSL